MATRAVREYQLVILGASGFTGQFVVEEVSRVADGEEFRGSGLRWAVAGRNKQKLEEVLDNAAERLGVLCFTVMKLMNIAFHLWDQMLTTLKGLSVTLMRIYRKLLCSIRHMQPWEVSVFKLMFAGIISFLFTKCSCGRKLLMKHPKFFSFGYFSRGANTKADG